MYKNIEKQIGLKLKDLVSYQEGQVVSKTLVQNDLVSMTIFSFDQGEEISTHAAGTLWSRCWRARAALPWAARCFT